MIKLICDRCGKEQLLKGFVDYVSHMTEEGYGPIREVEQIIINDAGKAKGRIQFNNIYIDKSPVILCEDDYKEYIDLNEKLMNKAKKELISFSKNE